MKYEATWESIDSRPVPEWFTDAKFGIFIHWGIYSVPAYAPKGQYSEWYGNFLRSGKPDNPYIQHHRALYGDKVKYENFVTDFRAENFDADEWVDLFHRSGAKYLNLVSKHHDGFCLYKTDYAWNWNSVDIGPGRDFCAELKAACDKSDVRFGVYHSVYEWYHPLYLKDPEEYALKHLIPMLKELVEKYQPATLFTDGEWDHPAEVWHSTEFLQWLYNESSVKDFIVPNDRWGVGCRGLHGGNFTTEYGQIGFGRTEMADDRTSEECRGIGCSFGWNKYEKVDDYLSAEALIKLLVDHVSRGSNLLLNIGPTPDGRIPVIMEERLLQIGKWLEINGEGIYASRKYKIRTDGDIRYTRSKDGSTVYAFVLRYPFGDIVLDDVGYSDSVRVSLLGYDGEIGTENAGEKLCLKCGAINPDRMKSRYVYCIKIQNQ